MAPAPEPALPPTVHFAPWSRRRLYMHLDLGWWDAREARLKAALASQRQSQRVARAATIADFRAVPE